MVGFPGRGKPDQPAKGSLSGVPACSAVPTGGGEAIFARADMPGTFHPTVSRRGPPGPSVWRRFAWPEALDQGQYTPEQRR